MIEQGNKPEESQLQLNIESKEEPPSLQRTDEWFEQRRGRWTGSQQKTLMSCSAAGSRLSWSDEAKLYHFGSGALKYIYENAMERKTKRVIRGSLGTPAMNYGTAVEPLILKSTELELKNMLVAGKIKEVGFKTFPTMPNAGVSSDSILVHKNSGKAMASVELKACTAWNTHFERTFEAVDEKSTDFWQTQAQMMAWDVRACYYVVAQPPEDIFKYLNYGGDIMDLYEDFAKECQITIQVIESSEVQQHALLRRICIAEHAIEIFLKDGGNLKEILYRSIDYFKNSPDELEKYIK